MYGIETMIRYTVQKTTELRFMLPLTVVVRPFLNMLALCLIFILICILDEVQLRIVHHFTLSSHASFHPEASA